MSEKSGVSDLQKFLRENGILSAEDEACLNENIAEEERSEFDRILESVDPKLAKTPPKRTETEIKKQEERPAAAPQINAKKVLATKPVHKPMTEREARIEFAKRTIEKTCGLSLIIKIREDSMVAWLSCDYMADFNVGNLSVEQFVRYLETCGVLAGFTREDLQKFLKRMEKQEYIQNEPVAYGKKAVSSQAQINLYFTPSGIVRHTVQPPEPEEEPSEEELMSKIDYRSKLKVSMAKEGQLLAERFPIETGSDGMTVRGIPLKAKTVEDQELIPGRNTFVEENQIFAKSAGRIIYEQGVLSVYPVFTFAGDLDLSSGSIKFHGDVEVLGDVKSGHYVHSGADVLVKGTVEAAEILAEGTVHVHGGFAGGSTGLIRANRDCFINHANAGILEVRGDLIVLKELINSNTYVGGNVRCSRNTSIIGGQIFVCQNLNAFNLGSALGVGTTVSMGSHAVYFKRLKSLKPLTQNLEKKLSILKSSLTKLKTEPPKDFLEADLQKVLKDLEKNCETIQQELIKLNTEEKFLEGEMNRYHASCLKIKGSIYPGVKILFGDVEFIVLEKMSLVEFYLDPTIKTIKHRRYVEKQR